MALNTNQPTTTTSTITTTTIFGMSLAEDKNNTITKMDDNTVYIQPRINTTGLTELKIGVLLPFSQKSDNFTAEIVWGGSSAIRMAVNEINAQQLIPGAYVSLIEKDSYPAISAQHNAVTEAVYASITLLQQGVIGVIGDVSSSWTGLSALMTSTLDIPQCSFTAGAVALSDKTQYKSFFRTIPTQVITADVMLAFAGNQGWSTVGVLYTDDPFGQQFSQHAILQATKMNMNVGSYQSFSLDNPEKDMTIALRGIVADGMRIILVGADEESQVALMVRAAEMGLMTDQYVWLLNGRPTETLLQTITTRNQNMTLQDQINYNSTYNGLFMFDYWLAPYGYGPFDSFLDAWSQLNPAVYPLSGSRTIKNNEGLAYSCMMLMAQGFKHAITGATDYTQSLQDLAAGNLGSILTPSAFDIGYVGPQGPVVLDNNGDPMTGNYLIYNQQYGDDVVIGHSLSGDLQLLLPPQFHDGSFQPPCDAPPSIALNPDLSSPIARVILAASSTGILFSLIVLILVILFRKHEIFKASSPLFCCLELLGFIITYVSVCLMIDVPSQATCYMRPLLLNLGFVLVLGNMIAKNYRIYRIFNNIFITRTVITDIQLIKTASLVVGVDMALFVTGLAIARPTPTRHNVSMTQHYWTCQSTSGAETVFTVLNTVYGAGLLLFATFLAYKTRGAGRRYSHYNETKQMGLSVYNILFSALVGFAVYVNPIADFYTTYYITVMSLLWAATFSLLVLFVPKLHAFCRQQWMEIKQRKQQTHQESSLGLNAVIRNVSDTVARAAGLSSHALPYPPNALVLSDSPLGGTAHTPIVHATHTQTNTGSHPNYIEMHEGVLPVRRVLRYFPFLSQWKMQHIMVFPWLGYFSYFSDQTKEGAIMTYTQVTVATEESEKYVLKVHGQGLYDMYIQLPDDATLAIWENSFHCTNMQGKPGSIMSEKPDSMTAATVVQEPPSCDQSTLSN